MDPSLRRRRLATPLACVLGAGALLAGAGCSAGHGDTATGSRAAIPAATATPSDTASPTAPAVLDRTSVTPTPTGSALESVQAAASAPTSAQASAPVASSGPPPSGAHLDPAADSHDFTVLQDDLGPDFSVKHGVSDPAVRPGSPSAAGLPDGVDTALSMNAWSVSGGSPSDTVCKPTGPSLDGKACTERTLPNGKRYLVQRPAMGAVAGMPSVTVYFIQPSKVVVAVNLTTRNSGGSDPDRASETLWWMEPLIPRLAAAAADDRMQPWLSRPPGPPYAPPAATTGQDR
jgi:hypothetical protein